MLVDDHIVVSSDTSPAFTRAHGNELWVLILEKAWAKLYGSFDNVESGLPHLALRDLTGAPAFHYDIGQDLEKDLETL